MRSEFLQFIIRHYGHALEYGSKYIYQCMPRMLSLWLDFGSTVPDGGVCKYKLIKELNSYIIIFSLSAKEKESKTLKMVVSQLNEVVN